MRPLMMSVLLLVLSAGASRASDSVVALKFRTAADMGPLAKLVKGPAGESAVEVTGEAKPSTTTLMVCESPAITSPDYLVRGRVKYVDVVGEGYLELWSNFVARGEFFSRTLADRGTMKMLGGTSDWRDFELPFHAEPGMKPQRLTLNVVLLGAGKVIVAQPLVVVPLSLSGQWWSVQQAGLIGGGLGSLVGILGGLVGLSMRRANARMLTLSLCGLAFSICSISLIVGIVAMSAGQPWHVGYPPLLLGAIGTAVLGFNLRTILRRFQDDELRRMAAVDVV